jgi:hypothetical protein
VAALTVGGGNTGKQVMTGPGGGGAGGAGAAGAGSDPGDVSGSTFASAEEEAR